MICTALYLLSDTVQLFKMLFKCQYFVSEMTADGIPVDRDPISPSGVDYRRPTHTQ